jgi:hypothetical protein
MTRTSRKGISVAELLSCRGRSTGGIGCMMLGTNTTPTIELGKEGSATGTGVDNRLFFGIQTQRSVCCHDGSINIFLINDHRDPDL